MAQETGLKENQVIQNDPLCSSGEYQKGLDLAENGKLAEALAYFQKYLTSSPKNAEILNDIGAILHCMHRSDEAVEYFLKAKALQPASAEILWNLSETYLASGHAEKAMELFDEMEKLDILNAEVLNRTAEILINAGNLSDADRMLNKSLELSPNQPILHPMIEVVRGKMAANKI